MPRTPRVVVPGVPHHVTQRGNRGADVFLDDDDYQQYLLWLHQYADKHRLKVWAYCLMTNHIHLVVVPESPTALAATMRPLQMRHAQALNARQQAGGHVWHSRYFSCAMDDDHLVAAVRYVERNPVRAGLVDRAGSYPWSSAPGHCRLRQDPFVEADMPLLARVSRWSEWLSDEDLRATERLRAQTMKGLPCGTQEFVDRMAEALGRPLLDRPRGRPKKGDGPLF
jgi:putative transposase